MSDFDRRDGRASGARARGAPAGALPAGAALALLTLSACSTHGHGEGAHHGDGGHGEGDPHAGSAGHGDGDRHAGPAGRPGDPGSVGRTVRIGMTDAMDYDPASLTVRRGETVRFAVRNGGRLVHEFVLGTDAGLLAHRETMTSHPDMRHDEPGMLSLEPGGSGEVIWTFTEPGTFTYACLRPGHYEAGMRGEVVVAAAR